jgi:hypothetical protein
MKPLFLVFFALPMACSSDGVLELDPVSLDWGEVDFHTEECMDCACPDGCGLTPLFLNNTGEAPLQIHMPNGFDDAHLCIDGYDSESNLDLGILQPGEFFLLNISVCGYEAGELNTEGEEPARPVTGSLRFSTDGEPAKASAEFSFVPVRKQQ